MNAVGRAGSVQPTGIAHLDDVLYGGIPIGGLTVIGGPSGSGKSMLAQQLARARPAATRYMLCDGVPAEAHASRHAEPRPTYIELGPALQEPALEPVMTELEAAYAADGVELVIFDTLDFLLGLPGPDYMRVLTRVCQLTWREHVATVALCSLLFHAGHPVTASATLFMELFRGDGVRGRRLLVHKLEGRPFRPGEHPFTLGPYGLTFDRGPALTPPETPVSGLGARILGAFRTTRRSSPSELAAMLGQDDDAVSATLDELARKGYLFTDTTEDGQVYYSVARGS